MKSQTIENVKQLTNEEIKQILRVTSERLKIERKGWNEVLEEMEREAFLYVLEDRVDPTEFFQEIEVVRVDVSTPTEPFKGRSVSAINIFISYKGKEYRISEVNGFYLENKDKDFGKAAYSWASEVVFEAFMRIAWIHEDGKEWIK